MNIKGIKKCWLLLIVFGLQPGASAQQQVKKDTLEEWMSKFYDTDGIAMSSDGKWIAIRKKHATNDSVMIFDTDRQAKVYFPALEATMVKFHSNHYAILTGSGKTAWLDLETKKKLDYTEVRQAHMLSSAGYCVLNTKGLLKIFDTAGKMLAELSGVIYYVTDEKEKLYILRKTETGNEIWKLQDLHVRKIQEQKEIEHIELTASGRNLIIYSKDKAIGFRTVILMNIQNETSVYPLGTAPIAADFFSVREIDKGSAFLIQGVTYRDYPEKKVEIWYGNDKNLESRQYGKIASNRYWMWKPGLEKGYELPMEERETVSVIGSNRYLLAFRNDELQDYIRYIPYLNLYLYDLQTASKINIGVITPSLFSSGNGNSLLFTDVNGTWQLLNVETLQKRLIEGKNLRKPYFSQDGKTIYFEGTSGLWKYSVAEDTLYPLNIGQNKRVQVIGATETSLCTGHNFYQNTVNDKGRLLLKIHDEENADVSYSIFEKGKNNELWSSPHIVKSLLFDKKLETFAVMEENYNMPPRLWVIRTKTKEKKLLFDSDSSDKQAKLLKQQMVSYTTSSGSPLKGTLYYPANYNPSREYPVIVHIYQRQTNSAKDYLLPRYDEVGFNIRTLLEQGYFVYLPDVVTENQSPGLSALDCVERSLDALKNYPVNFKGFGLMGHSFGSYLTNFIATHSDKFTAYISGSGVSDLISSYFSYNRNYDSPHYWQVETGQYSMNVSFAENKALYLKNSPILHSDKVNAPMLLWTGLKDENVVPDQTMEFYISLRRSGKQVIALFYPEGGHDLGIGTVQTKDLNKRVIEWWDYFLKERKNIPWIDKQMK